MLTERRSRPATIPETFWSGLAAAPTALLLLDYDGTLAPFRVERHKAEPYPGVRPRLRRLLRSGGTRLVVVSGRPAADVARLLGVFPPPEIWGMHGFERRLPDGTLERQKLGRSASRLLRRATDLAEALLPAECVERKPAAVAFHWRGLPRDEAATARRRLQEELGELLAGSALECHPFDGGLEVRPREVDKGHAVTRLLAEAGAQAVAAYLGDDLTDEDAFRALGERGLPVLVRSRPRPTAARARLEPPHELIAFLDRWLSARGKEPHA